MFGHGHPTSDYHSQAQSQWTASPSIQYQHLDVHQHQHEQQQQQQQHHQHALQHQPQHRQYTALQPYQYTLANPTPSYEYASGPATPAEFASRPPSSSSSAALPGEYTTQAGFVQQHQHQQHHHRPQVIESEPPNSSGSVGSGSVSSGESAATTGPSSINAMHPPPSHDHYSHHKLPVTPSSIPHPTMPGSTSAAQHDATTQASPLFDVPPGYRTMLSSDKPAAPSQQQQSHNPEIGGSAPVRHHSMPSTSAFPSSGALSFMPGGVHPANEQPQQQPTLLQPVLQEHHRSQHTPHSSASAPSPFIHTPTPYYTASPAPIHSSYNTPSQSQSQHPYPSSQQHQNQFLSSSNSGSGSFAATSGTSNSTTDSSKTGRSTRYPRRQMHQSEDVAHTPAPQSSLQLGNMQDTQFLAPAPPTSAPATTTSFAISGLGSSSGTSRQMQGQSGMFKLEPTDESYMKFAARNSVSSSSAGMSTNASSAIHSRSPSVSSATYSSFGPLSASTSSSASSSFGDLSSSTSTPRRAMRLSNLDRRALCQYAEANPRVKHEHIGSMFGVERSTVSKILKQKAKWFTVSDDNKIPISPTGERKTREGKLYKNRIGRHPEMEAMLIGWGKEQTRNNTILTDESVRVKALEYAEQLKIESGSFKASAGWLENFKERAKYKAGKFDLDAVPPSLFPSSPSSRDPSEEIMDDDADTGETTVMSGEIKASQESSEQLSVGGGGTTFADNLGGHVHSPQSSAARAASPLRHRRQKRGGLSSLSSSSISLPDLVERNEQQHTDLETSSSSIDLRSGGSSFSNLNMQPLRQGFRHHQHSSISYSTDTSPLPSPTCSTGSELSQSIPNSTQASLAGPLIQTSTPTQRTVHNVAYTPQSGDHQHRHTYATGPPSTRLQQAGINFNLSLNSSPASQPLQSHHLPTIEAGQPLDVMRLSSGQEQKPSNFESFAYPNAVAMSPPRQQAAFDMSQGDTIYSLRSRIHSAPGNSQPIVPYALNADDPAQQQHNQPVVYDFNSGSPSLHHDQYLEHQHKAPLHRSQTDPMPLYSSVSMVESHGDEFLHPADSTLTLADAGDMGGMQIDSAQHQAQEGALPFQTHHYAPQLSHMYAQAPHARRATVSSGGDLSFSSGSGTGSSYGHGHSYSMSAVNTPIFGSFAAAADPPSASGITKVSLQEAYLSLRKVMTFLQDSDVSKSMPSSLATPSQTEALEALLAQLRQAHIAQIPTLTPPRST